MGTPTIGLLHPSKASAAAAALARAFQDDPLQAYVLPDATERRAKSPSHFAPIVAYGLRFGRVYTTLPDPIGAVVWLPPDAWNVTPERAAAVGLDRLGDEIGEDAAKRFLDVIGFAEGFHHQDVEHDHWYTMVLGVSPEGQGRGLGRALMEPIFAEADANGLPCYLETTQPTNVTLYEHLGFRVIRHAVEPVSKIDVWTLRRRPGPNK